MEFLEAKAIAERLGFQLFADVRGDTNALRLFTEDFRQKYGKKYRCGVYMQFRADGSCYIGQSLDVDRRHKLQTLITRARYCRLLFSINLDLPANIDR